MSFWRCLLPIVVLSFVVGKFWNFWTGSGGGKGLYSAKYLTLNRIIMKYRKKL